MVDDLWSALGYESVAEKLATALRSTDDVLVVQGPPGVGKSSLAKEIGSFWRTGGGSTVVAEGDLLRSDVPLYPLGFALAELSSTWRSLGAPLAGASRGAESLVGTAGIVTSVVQGISRVRPRRVKARKLFLGEAEQQVLFDLDRLAHGRSLLIIADNLHWWDTHSLDLLGRLRSPRMQESFDFLQNVRILAIQTVEPYQHVTSPTSHDAFVNTSTTRRFELARVPERRFDRVLEAMGVPASLAVEYHHTVYALTGGHLALARRCAAQLVNGQTALFAGFADPDDFVTRLLRERLRALGAVGQEAVQLLEIAAVLGLRFRRMEIGCAASGESSHTAKLLRYLRDEDLIELSNDVGWFVHDVYRQHFLATPSIDRPSLHERLGDCLRQLSPGDYEARCRNALLAEQTTEAAQFGVQAVLARRREGQTVAGTPQAVLSAIADGGLSIVLGQLTSAYDHAISDRHDACRTALAMLPHALGRTLLAEADYIRATSLMTTRSDADRAQGRAVLEAWEGIEDDESELGARVLQLRLFGLTMLVDKAEGREVERQICRVFQSRAEFDRDAVDALYTLDRCSSSLYEPDQALIRTRRAVEHFRAPSGGGVVRRPVELYRCLTNWIADLVINARYEEAVAASVELERLVDTFQEGLFPRLDHVYTNCLLARVRAGHVDVRAALNAQRAILDRYGNAEDPFYETNAWAVYRCLDGDPVGALDVYDRLLARLRSRWNPEPSMIYLLRANRAAVMFVGGVGDVIDEWRELRDVLAQVPYPIARFLRRRHELLAGVIESGAELTPAQFDVCLTSGPPELGPMWDHLCRGFRLPEIQWWH